MLFRSGTSAIDFAMTLQTTAQFVGGLIAETLAAFIQVNVIRRLPVNRGQLHGVSILGSECTEVTARAVVHMPELSSHFLSHLNAVATVVPGALTHAGRETGRHISAHHFRISFDKATLFSRNCYSGSLLVDGWLESNEQALEAGVITKCDIIEEIVEATGLDLAAVQGTIDYYNQCAENNDDMLFHRGQAMNRFGELISVPGHE